MLVARLQGHSMVMARIVEIGKRRQTAFVRRIGLPAATHFSNLPVMKPVPGTLRAGGAPFQTTHWSVIADCARTDEQGGKALSALCRDYWPPLYSFARRRGYSPSDAQDLVQGFFAAFLQNKAYLRTNRDKGRFRTFMLASLKNFLANEWHRERALKRGGDREFVLLQEDMKAAESLYDAQTLDARKRVPPEGRKRATDSHRPIPRWLFRNTRLRQS